MSLHSEHTFEVLATFYAVKTMLLMALEVLVEQILACERLVAHLAAELGGIHVEYVVPRQVVQPRVYLGTNVTGELDPLGMTFLMVLQVPLLGERLVTGAADDLIAFVFFHIHMICQLLTR